MVVSDFQNFWILTPKISKNKFFWEKCSKIQNFQNFQKTVLYVKDLLESSQHAKFQIRISMFDPQMTVISVKCGDVVTRISFIFRDYNLNSHLQNYVSRLQSNCKNVPETADIQDSSGRLIGGFAGVVGHDSKEEVLKCNENLVHF